MQIGKRCPPIGPNSQRPNDFCWKMPESKTTEKFIKAKDPNILKEIARISYRKRPNSFQVVER
jgi:hypothetical protein